jgi:hypothetical protein
MKVFECQNCSKPLYFENASCDSCGSRLGYLPELEVVTALEPVEGSWRALADPGTRYRFCTNAQHDVCNWLLHAEHTDAFCLACRHNRGIPDLSNADNVALWRKTEFAKHRLFYTLLRLRLPLTTKAEDPNGLAFDFLSDPPDASMRRVMTGHADGLITLNVAEADDPERERRRKSLREPYRTLLGHFRHEIAHYYWLHLVANSPAAEDFRRLFGDEREDYSAALQRYHGNGPPSDWGEHFITAYASAHPWEDFAETWAHYFHMIDTLETAAMFGMRLQPAMPKSTSFMAGIDFDPHIAEMDQIIDAWLPLTFALNSVNRSMGGGPISIRSEPACDLQARIRSRSDSYRRRAHDRGRRDECPARGGRQSEATYRLATPWCIAQPQSSPAQERAISESNRRQACRMPAFATSALRCCPDPRYRVHEDNHRGGIPSNFPPLDSTATIPG